MSLTFTNPDPTATNKPFPAAVTGTYSTITITVDGSFPDPIMVAVPLITLVVLRNGLVKYTGRATITPTYGPSGGSTSGTWSVAKPSGLETPYNDFILIAVSVIDMNNESACVLGVNN